MAYWVSRCLCQFENIKYQMLYSSAEINTFNVIQWTITVHKIHYWYISKFRFHYVFSHQLEISTECGHGSSFFLCSCGCSTWCQNQKYVCFCRFYSGKYGVKCMDKSMIRSGIVYCLPIQTSNETTETIFVELKFN